MSFAGSTGLDACLSMLRKQHEQLKAAKSHQGMKPARGMKRSRAQLEREYGDMALQVMMMEMQLRGVGSLGGAMVQSTFIGEAYAPCTEPLAKLKPILLRDLVLETHHRGRVLVVRAFAAPSRMSSIQNAIEDETGDVERLAIYNLPKEAKFNKVLPRGALLAVKEPYYKITADGGVMVRVDHPSDFVALKPDDPLVPAKLRKPAAAKKKTALQLKTDGNTAFKFCDWEGAVDCYTQALDLTAGNSEKEGKGAGDDGDRLALRRALRLNRAEALLRLDRYELALEDATSCVVPGQPSSEVDGQLQQVKALFRAGRAAYELGDFSQARGHYRAVLEIIPTHQQAGAELRRAEKRIGEQKDGKYDLDATYRSASVQHRYLDHASFLANTTVKPAGHRGRGLFATRNLKRGELIMAEKGFCVAFEGDGAEGSPLLINTNTNRVQMGTHSLRLQGLIDKMSFSPKQAGLYLDLWDGGRFGKAAAAGAAAKFADDKVVLDVFRTQAIAELNGYGCPKTKSSPEGATDDDDAGVGGSDGAGSALHNTGSTGIWVQASYANHSCLPNATRCFVGDMMILRANANIKAGEEIFTTYLAVTSKLADRKKHFGECYGFECDCALCAANEKVPAEVMTEREQLSKKADKFIESNTSRSSRLTTTTTSTAATQAANKMLEQLRATFDPMLYGGEAATATATGQQKQQQQQPLLPRMACVGLGLWLCKSSSESSTVDNAAVLNAATGTLRDLGYACTVARGGRGKVRIERSEGSVVLPPVLHAAMYAAEACLELGNRKGGAAFVRMAREAWVLLYVTEQGFEQHLGGVPGQWPRGELF